MLLVIIDKHAPKGTMYDKSFLSLLTDLHLDLLPDLVSCPYHRLSWPKKDKLAYTKSTLIWSWIAGDGVF